MRVLVLGAAGHIGEAAVGSMAAYSQIDKLILADKAVQRARELADRLDTRAMAVEFDAEDADGLRDLISSADLVVNAVGPYFHFGMHILQTALEAGRSCADVCDDWRPIVQALELDQKARDAGVTFLLGFGLSPGLSNLLAVRAASTARSK